MMGASILALREGNAIYRIDPVSGRIEHLAGTGEQGYSGDGGPARSARLAGPKGLAFGRDGRLFVADTENHVIRAIDLKTGLIPTVLGTGQRGDGPETQPVGMPSSRDPTASVWTTKEHSTSLTAKPTVSGALTQPAGSAPTVPVKPGPLFRKDAR